MNLKKYKCLPRNLLEIAHSLESIGIHELAWKSREAIDVIEHLADQRFVILGGDVYQHEGTQWISTYDNWFYEQNHDENPSETSRNLAIRYVSNYVKTQGDSFYYVIIFESPKPIV